MSGYFDSEFIGDFFTENNEEQNFDKNEPRSEETVVPFGIASYNRQFKDKMSLTDEEYRVNIAKWNNTSVKAEKREIETTIIRGMQGIVRSYANKFINAKVDLEDLYSEGNLGVLQAISKYDPYAKSSFVTYAYYKIVKNILSFVQQNSKVVYVPGNKLEDLSQLHKAQMEYDLENNEEPTVEQLAFKLKWSISRVKQTLMCDASVTSLDQPIASSHNTDEEITIGDTIEDTDESPENKALSSEFWEKVLKSCFKDHTLTAAEYDILTKRGVMPVRSNQGDLIFLDKQSRREISEAYGWSEEEVRGTEMHAYAKLKELDIIQAWKPSSQKKQSKGINR